MTTVSSNIRDNCKREKAARFLSENLCPDAILSVASAYFTVQAYDQLREKLDAIASMRFLFGDPDYVNKIDPEKTASKRFAIVNNGQDMSRYDAILAKALTDVAQKYRRRIARGLTTSRDFVIPTQSAAPAEFELLTWLVIMAG